MLILRIAMLSVHSSPLGKIGTKNTGGMSIYLQELAQELSKEGHYVDIFTRRTHPDQTDTIYLNPKVRVINITAGENCEIAKEEIQSLLPDFAAAVECFRKKEKIIYQIIHSHYWLSGLAGLILKKIWHIPVLATFHTLAAVKDSVGVGKKEPVSRLVGEKQIVSLVDRVIASTYQEKNDLINYYQAHSAKISLIPGGVNRNRFYIIDRTMALKKLGIDSHEKIILSVGRIDPIKGQDLLIRAFSQLEQINGLKIVFIGGDDQSNQVSNQLKQIIVELKLEEHVNFYGRVEHSELLVWYNVAEMLIVSSHHESFGLTTLEAMSCGTPVVASRVKGADNFIAEPQNGLLFSPGSALELSQKINLARQIQWDKNFIRRSTVNLTWNHTAALHLKEYMMVLKEEIS